ncbi:Vacuolar protein sorting-associated protein 53 [Kappamyces sp. JEL0680]|nr:Vacuolar protein sorting-associated protein 53 [Kappamyces sp. JEL0680]
MSFPPKPSLQIRKITSTTRKEFSPAASVTKIATPAPQFEDSKLDIIELSPELDARMAKVLGESGDKRNVSTIQSVNELFPDEESLMGADEVLLRIRSQITALDVELRKLVRVNSNEKDTKELVAQIKSEIKELIATVQVIKEKASHSENTVMEITRDIKSLDETKLNLTQSMNLLKRIHLTVNALEYVKGLSNRKQYGNVAEILSVLLRVAAPLKEYKENPQLAGLCEKLSAFQLEIKKTIFQEFEGAFNGGTIAMQAPTLYEACYVLELLEMDAKSALSRWYTEMQLLDYRNLFRKNPEVAGLPDISRRYAWMKRMLKTYDESHAVLFPEHWKMAETLCWQFCQETKRDLAEVIIKSERDSSFDTRTMLAAIQTTVEFEEKLEFRFITKGRDPAEIPKEELNKFKRIISSVFDSFLWHYIDMEDQVMSEKFDGFRRSLGEIEDGVYSSSFDLFLFYRQTFANCAKLSTGKPFLDLTKMYQKWLDKYKDLLLSKLPKYAVASNQ